MAKTFETQAIDRLEVTIGAKKLGEIFLGLGYLNRAKLERALQYQRGRAGGWDGYWRPWAISPGWNCMKVLPVIFHYPTRRIRNTYAVKSTGHWPRC